MISTVAEMFQAISRVAKNEGFCDVSEFQEAINFLAPSILNDVDPKGDRFTWCLCVCSGCVHLPSDLDSVSQAWFSGKAMGHRTHYWSGRITADIPEDQLQEFPWREMVHEDKESPLPSPWDKSLGSMLSFQSVYPSDMGAEIQVHYKDGPPCAVKLLGDNAMTQAAPCGEPVRIKKDRTEGEVRVFQQRLDGGKTHLFNIGAKEECPAFRKIFITGKGKGSLVVKGKKRWVPIRSEEDILPFGNAMAWASLLRGYRYEIDGNVIEAGKHYERAIGLIEKEKSAILPKAVSRGIQAVTPFTLKSMGHDMYSGNPTQ